MLTLADTHCDAGTHVLDRGDRKGGRVLLVDDSSQTSLALHGHDDVIKSVADIWRKWINKHPVLPPRKIWHGALSELEHMHSEVSPTPH